MRNNTLIYLSRACYLISHTTPTSLTPPTHIHVWVPRCSPPHRCLTPRRFPSYLLLTLLLYFLFIFYFSRSTIPDFSSTASLLFLSWYHRTATHDWDIGIYCMHGTSTQMCIRLIQRKWSYTLPTPYNANEVAPSLPPMMHVCCYCGSQTKAPWCSFGHSKTLFISSVGCLNACSTGCDSRSFALIFRCFNSLLIINVGFEWGIWYNAFVKIILFIILVGNESSRLSLHCRVRNLNVGSFIDKTGTQGGWKRQSRTDHRRKGTCGVISCSNSYSWNTLKISIASKPHDHRSQYFPEIICEHIFSVLIKGKKESTDNE